MERNSAINIAIGCVMASLLNVNEKTEIIDALRDMETDAVARETDKWHEEIGDVLWWKFPIEEPPYCGTPLDSDWPAYHTHWTPITEPVSPE